MAKKNPAVLWNVDQTGNVIGAAGRQRAQKNIGITDGEGKLIGQSATNSFMTSITLDDSNELKAVFGRPTLLNLTPDTDHKNFSIGTNSETGAIEAQDLKNPSSSTDGNGTTYVSSVQQASNGKVSYKTQTITRATDESHGSDPNFGDIGITTLISSMYASNDRTTGHNVAVTPDGVWNAIDSAINSLDVTDSAVTNQFITSVSESDGIISVTRAQPSIGDLVASSNTNYSIGTNSSTGKIEAQNLTVSTATDGGDSDDLTFVSSVTQASNGKISVTTKHVPYSIQFIDTSYTYDQVLELIAAGKYPVVRYQNGYDTLYLPMFTAPASSGTYIEFRGFAKNTESTIYKITCGPETGFGELTGTTFVSISDASNVTTTTQGPDEQYTNHVSTLDIDLDTCVVTADSSLIGCLAPVMTPTEDRVLKMFADDSSPKWAIDPITPTGDEHTPIYIKSDGTFDECSISDAVFIQFDLNNTTTAQDAVYAAIDAAYAAHKFPVLYSVGRAGDRIYWFPNASTTSRYSFAYHTSSSCETATFISGTHILTLAQKSIIDYTAGTGIAINDSTISCTVGSPIYTQNNGQGGIVEHQVSKLSLDTDFQQILADGNEIGVYAPTPAIAATDKVLTVAAGSDAPVWMDKPSGSKIKTVSTTLPPVETDVSSMTLFDDGRVRVNNSTEVGLLAPTGTQSDNGKVLVGNYSGSPGKFVAKWGDISSMVSTYPKIDFMGHVTYNVNLSAANYLNMEDGVCYDIMSNAGGSYTLHLQTNSTTTIHSKIYLWGEQANCMSATIVYEDEGGEVSQLQYTYGDTSENTIYALDIFARKVHVSGGISFDTTMCRVYDYPCARRDIHSYNEDLGRIVEYVEPL